LDGRSLAAASSQDPVRDPKVVIGVPDEVNEFACSVVAQLGVLVEQLGVNVPLVEYCMMVLVVVAERSVLARKFLQNTLIRLRWFTELGRRRRSHQARRTP
jgi:hypothetical protein